MLKFEIREEEKQYFVDGLKAAEEIVKVANKHSDLPPVCLVTLEAEVFKKIASNIFWISEKEKEHVEPVFPESKEMKSKSEDKREASYRKMDKLFEKGRIEREERKQAGIRIGAISDEKEEGRDAEKNTEKENTLKIEEIAGKDLTITGATIKPSSESEDKGKEYASIKIETKNVKGIFSTGSKVVVERMKHAAENNLFPLKVRIEKRNNRYTFKTLAEGVRVKNSKPGAR